MFASSRSIPAFTLLAYLFAAVWCCCGPAMASGGRETDVAKPVAHVTASCCNPKVNETPTLPAACRDHPNSEDGKCPLVKARSNTFAEPVYPTAFQLPLDLTRFASSDDLRNFARAALTLPPRLLLDTGPPTLFALHVMLRN